MLKFLKFDISAEDRTGAAMGRVRSELKGVRGALASVSDQARRTGRSMRNIGAGMSAAITAPLTFLGRDAIRLYDQQVQAEGTVQQALKSTGGAAGRTMKDLKGLASSLQAVTTYGDEDILRNVTAPLLTFTKVQGDTFDRAQGSVLDMATLLKMDLKSASLMVGKALNDPAKGMAALSRSGVQFTDDQKNMVKAMVKTGDVAGAQAVILGELESQFKGQAAALANTPMGKWQQLSNAIGDVKEQLGEQIVPFLTPLVDKVGEAVAWFGELDPAVKKNIVVFGGIAAVAGPVLGILGMATIGVTGLAGAFATLSAVLWANPIVAIIGAIAVGALLIYRNWDSVAGYFTRVFEEVKTAIQDPWSWIKQRFLTTWNPTNIVMPEWNKMPDFFRDLGPMVQSAFVAIWDSIKAEIGSWPARMKASAIEMGTSFVEGLNSMNPSTWFAGKMAGEAAAWGIAQGAKARAGEVEGAGRGLGAAITNGAKDELGIQSPSKIFQAIGSDVVGGLVQGIAENGNAAVDEVRRLTDEITQEGQKAVSVTDRIKGSAKSAFTSVLTRASTVRQAAASMLSGFGNQLIGSAVDGLFDAIWPFAKGAAISSGRVTAFANGGVVGSPTYFGMRGGTGLMGEAGPEGILPLARTSAGKLGVHTTGGGGGGIARVEVALDVPEGVTVQQVEQISGGIAVSVFQSGSRAQMAAMPATQANMIERYT